MNQGQPYKPGQPSPRVIDYVEAYCFFAIGIGSALIGVVMMAFAGPDDQQGTMYLHHVDIWVAMLSLARMEQVVSGARRLYGWLAYIVALSMLALAQDATGWANFSSTGGLLVSCGLAMKLHYDFFSLVPARTPPSA